MAPAVDALIAHVELHVDEFDEPTADLVVPSGDDTHDADEVDEHGGTEAGGEDE